MITGFYISFISFLVVFTFVMWRWWCPKSFSDTRYLVGRDLGIVYFYGAMILITFPFMMYWIELSEGYGQPFAFLSCAGLLLVGAAADYKDQDVTTITHYAGTIVGAALSQLWIILYTPFWLFSIALLLLLGTVGYHTKGKTSTGAVKNSLIFYLEVAAFLSTYIAVYGFDKLMN